MKSRRHFLGALLLASMPARAQVHTKRVGLFQAGRERDRDYEAAVAGEFARRGVKVEIVPRFVANFEEPARAAARELVAEKVDLILTTSTPFTRYARDATRTIPIVTDLGDPVGAGLAHESRRPGGNVTGLSQGLDEVFVKLLEMLRSLAPDTAAVGWLAHSREKAWLPVFESAARTVGLPVQPLLLDGSIPDPAPLRKSVAAFRQRGGRVAHFFSQYPPAIERAAALALEHRIVLSGGEEDAKLDGFLIHYAGRRSNDESLAQRVGIAVRILQGEDPAGIPFEAPQRYRLLLNRRTAARIGITLPRDLLILADKVVS